jgi:hypothetical protein
MVGLVKIHPHERYYMTETLRNLLNSYSFYLLRYTDFKLKISSLIIPQMKR